MRGVRTRKPFPAPLVPRERCRQGRPGAAHLHDRLPGASRGLRRLRERGAPEAVPLPLRREALLSRRDRPRLWEARRTGRARPCSPTTPPRWAETRAPASSISGTMDSWSWACISPGHPEEGELRAFERPAPWEAGGPRALLERVDPSGSRHEGTGRRPAESPWPRCGAARGRPTDASFSARSGRRSTRSLTRRALDALRSQRCFALMRTSRGRGGEGRAGRLLVNVKRQLAQARIELGDLDGGHPSCSRGLRRQSSRRAAPRRNGAKSRDCSAATLKQRFVNAVAAGAKGDDDLRAAMRAYGSGLRPWIRRGTAPTWSRWSRAPSGMGVKVDTDSAATWARRLWASSRRKPGPLESLGLCVGGGGLPRPRRQGQRRRLLQTLLEHGECRRLRSRGNRTPAEGNLADHAAILATRCCRRSSSTLPHGGWLRPGAARASSGRPGQAGRKARGRGGTSRSHVRGRKRDSARARARASRESAVHLPDYRLSQIRSAAGPGSS